MTEILVIEDNQGDFVLVREMLAEVSDEFSFNLHWADSFSKGIEIIGESHIDIVMLDLSLPDAHGLDAYYSFRAVAPRTPVVVVSGNKDPVLANEAVKSGAQDFLAKESITGPLLKRSLSYAIERFEIRRKMENSLEEVQRMAKTRGEMLVNLTNEIHSPLYSIIRAAEHGLAGELPAPAVEDLTTVKQSAQTLLSLFNDIIDFTKMDAGGLSLATEDFRFRDFVSEIVSLLGERAKHKDISISVSVADDVPDALKGDIERLSQVLRNFITNFISHAQYGGEIEVHAELEEKQEKRCDIHFSVVLKSADIPLEKQKLIFESFAQADASSARKYGSMGLGLAVSARLVELMSGRAWVESDSEVGNSSFHFTSRFGFQS